jgi:hypothetical protein
MSTYPPRISKPPAGFQKNERIFRALKLQSNFLVMNPATNRGEEYFIGSIHQIHQNSGALKIENFLSLSPASVREPRFP